MADHNGVELGFREVALVATANILDHGSNA
jgi:hypothetical protein